MKEDQEKIAYFVIQSHAFVKLQFISFRNSFMLFPKPYRLYHIEIRYIKSKIGVKINNI